MTCCDLPPQACSRKLTPLRQWFYFDALECLPEEEDEDVALPETDFSAVREEHPITYRDSDISSNVCSGTRGIDCSCLGFNFDRKAPGTMDRSPCLDHHSKKSSRGRSISWLVLCLVRSLASEPVLRAGY